MFFNLMEKKTKPRSLYVMCAANVLCFLGFSRGLCFKVLFVSMLPESYCTLNSRDMV